MSNLLVLLGFIVAVSSLFAFVNGHAYMYEPTARASIWRNNMAVELLGITKNCSHNVKFNVSGPWTCMDNQMNCGDRGDGVGKGQDLNYSNCGVCGDDFNETRPRSTEHNGRLDKNIVVANYIEGQRIHTRAFVTNPHMGYMQWRLCVISNLTEGVNGRWDDEVKECFDKHLLLRTDGTDRLNVTLYARPLNTGADWERALWPDLDWDTDNIKHNPEGPVYLQLPNGVTCERCVIQYTYRAGRVWRGTKDFNQETFRGCADGCSDDQNNRNTETTPVKAPQHERISTHHCPVTKDLSHFNTAANLSWRVAREKPGLVKITVTQLILQCVRDDSVHV